MELKLKRNLIKLVPVTVRLKDWRSCDSMKNTRTCMEECSLQNRIFPCTPPEDSNSPENVVVISANFEWENPIKTYK